jgi:shikimate dehydrogenase
VSIWNRTPERAAGLDARPVRAAVAADVLVNCTSVGLDRPSTEESPFKDLPLDADALGEYTTVVDLVYRAGGTALIREAAKRGIDTIDGLEILVRQGALSFTLWTGLAAPLDSMRAAARDAETRLDAS